MLRDVIRKFKVDRDHVYISNNAQKLWNNIMVKNDMYNYQYTDRIICTKKSDSKVKLYKSNENKPFSTTTLSLGNEYKYNNIFHDDHMIPLSVLINRLTSYDRINEKEVNEVLKNLDFEEQEIDLLGLDQNNCCFLCFVDCLFGNKDKKRPPYNPFCLLHLFQVFGCFLHFGMTYNCQFGSVEHQQEYLQVSMSENLLLS